MIKLYASAFDKFRNLFFALSLLLGLLPASDIYSQTVQTFSTSGTWTVPAGVTSVKVEVWGGGGGGGGAYSFGSGGGGGGGSYNTATFTVSPGNTYNIAIGAGGTGGTGTATSLPGITGSTSTFTNGIQTVNALGGEGGTLGNENNGTGGNGGTNGTVGSFNGGVGGSTPFPDLIGSGGGGGAGNNAIGGSGSETAAGTGGAGNPNVAPYVGGNGGTFITTDGTGSNGKTPGGGGGGALYTVGDANGYSGSAGGDGQIVLTFTSISITGFSPTSECANSFTPVVITGSGFTGATAVTFNGTPAATFTVDNDGQITATPAAGTTTGAISVTAPGGTVTSTGTFTVIPANTASAASSTPTLCINTALTNITHTTTGATGITNDGVSGANGLPAGVSATWAGNTITISGTPTASGTFNYSIPLTGGCGAINATGTITVTPNNTAEVPSSTPTLCISTALTNITIATTGATGIGVATGLPAGVSATWAGNTITISGTPTASGTFNYSIPLTGGCGVVNATGTITVTAANTVGAASSTPTLCINSALTNITHTTTGATGISNDNVTGANGLPAGVKAHWAANTITISGTPTASGTFNYSIPLTGGCGAVNATGTITVTSANTTSAASSTPTLCINTALTNITHTTTGATGIGVATGLPAGVSATWAGNTITISGTPTASGTFNYTIPLTGGCGAVNATGTITVTVANTVTVGSSTPTLCINTALTNITHTTTGATGIGFATGLPAGVSAAWASNKITISGTPTASGTFNYTIPLTGGCGVVNATGTITVTAANTASAASSTPTLCINTALTNITHTTTGATGIGVATGLPAGVSAAWASNKITISGTPTASGTFNYTIPLTGGCGAINATGTITVNALPTISITPSAPSICNGSNTSLTASGASTYTWSPATGLSGTTGATVTASPTSSISYTVTGTNVNGCANTGVVSVAVTNPPATTGVTICAGGAGSLTSSAACAAGASATAGPSFPASGASSGGSGTAWSSPGSINANDGVYASVSGRGSAFDQSLYATNFGFSIPGTANITGIQVTIGRFASSASGGAAIQDNLVQLIQGGIVGGNNYGTATNWPTSETAANYGSSSDLWGSAWTVAQINNSNFGVALRVNNTSNFTSRTANVDYITVTITYTIPGTLNWYTVSSGGAAIGNGSPFNPVGVPGSGLANTNTPGTYNFYAECGAAPGCRTLTPFVINALPAATISYGGSPYCSNSGTATVTQTGQAGGTYSSTGSLSINSITGAVNLSASTAGTYTVTYSFNNGTCTNTTTAQIIINPAPAATISYSASQYCTSSGTVSVTRTGTSGGTYSEPSGGLTINSSTGAITPSSSTAGTYTVTYTIGASGGCALFSTTTTVTITALPTATISYSGSPYCSTSGTATVTQTGTTGGTYSASPGGLSINSGTGAINLSASTAGTYTVSYTIAASGGCAAVVKTTSITITAAPSATISYSGTPFCTNSGTGNVTRTGTSGGTYSASPGGLSINSGTGAINLSASTAGTYTVTYAIAASGGCAAFSTTTSVTINPVPTAGAITGASNVCIGSNITLVANPGGGTTPFTYTWTSSNTGVATVDNSGNVTGKGAGTTTIRYTVTDANGCSSATSPGFTVTVTQPTAGAITQASGLTSVCMNSTLPLTSNASGAGPFTYTWASSNNAIATVDNTGLVTGITAGTVNINYIVTDVNGCASATSAAYSVTVLAVPTGTFTATENSGIAPNDNIICAGDNVTFAAPPGYNSYIFYVNGTQVLGPTTNNLFNTTSLNSGDKVTVSVANASNCGATFGPITITVNAPPTPTLSADNTTICAGQTVTFTAGGGGAGSVYTFELDGSPVQSGASNIYTNSSLNNNDKVTVILTDANKCAATYATPIVITVNSLPSVSLTSIPNPAKVCAGSNITFTATSGFTSYEFFVNGVSQGVITTNTFSSTTLTNGSIVTVKATNSSSCSNTSSGVPVTVNALPTGTLTVTENSGTPNDNIICAGAPVTFTVTPTAGDTYAFYLNGTGTALQTGSSNKYTSTTLANGNYITVVVSNSNGCQITLTSPAITVNPIPTGSLTPSPSNTICAGSSVTFTADAGYSNYNFKVNGATEQNGSGNTFTRTTFANNNVVTVDVTNSNGCVATFGPVTMHVNPLPTGTLAIAETSGVADNDGIICTGASVTFTAPTGFSNYNFLLNGASIQNSSSNIYNTTSLNNNDKVTVTVTNGSGCVGLLNSYTITVNPLPVVAAITGTMSVCVNSTTALSDATSGGTWSSSDATIATVDASGVVTGVKAGTVNIIYTVTNGNDCSQTVTASVTVNALPVVAAIGGLSDVCVNSTIPLTDATSGGTWSTGDGTIATIDGSGNVTGVANGTVTISYSVTNGNGCTTIVTKSINVHALPVVPAITGTFSVCVNATTTLSNTASGGVWSSGATGIAIINASTGEVTGIAAGTATISYKVTNANGCVTTVTQDVTVNALPVPTLSGPNPICLGSTGNVYTTQTGSGINNYIWNIVNGNVTAGGNTSDNTVTVSWLTLGAKSISVNYTDANGCVGAAFATVVNAPGTSPVVSGPQTVCQGSAGVVYTAPAGEIDYSWTVSAGGTITSGGSAIDPTVTVTWNGSGAQSVTINYADPGGCSAATPTVWPVTVNPLPTLVINNPLPVCSPSTVDLTAAAVTTGSTTGLTYTYYTDAGGTITLVSPNAVATSGTYYIKGTTAAGCSDVIKPVTITINPLPTANEQISGNPVCQGSASPTVTFTGTAGTAPFTFNYNINGGSTQTITTTSGNSVTISAPTGTSGSFIYNLVSVQDANGCSQAQPQSVTVTVNPIPSVTNSPLTQTICSGGSTTLVNLTSSVAGATFAWTATATAGVSGFTASGTNTIPVQTISTTGTTQGTVTYAITPVASGCPGAVTNYTILVNPVPTVVINNPAAVCAPATVDLTAAAVTAGSTSGLTYTYYTDAAGTTTLASPNAVATSGTYYIKGTTAAGCSDVIKPVTVTINPLPTLVINNPAAICAPSTVDLTAAAVTSGSTSGLTYTYYTDAGGTTTLASPNAVATSGTYYIKGTTAAGCSAAIQPVVVTVTPAPTAVAGTAVSTCANSGAVNITAGASATNQSSVLWTSSGTGTFANANSLTTATYTPSAADITAGSVTLTLTANGNGSCVAVTSTKTLTISAIPTISVVPVTATICQGSIQALTATSTGSPAPQPQTFSSGSINVNIPDATTSRRNGTIPGFAQSSITVSGIPAGAVITNITVTINAIETSDGDLYFNIGAPNGKNLNLVSTRGNSGDNFTNTSIAWNGGVSFGTASAPFSGTFAPDANLNVGGPGGTSSNVNNFSSLTSIPNGTWTLYAEDNVANGSSGSIKSWSVKIDYTVPVSNPVTWSPVTDLYTDAAATIAYTGQSLTTVYASPNTSGGVVYTATATNAAGCTNTAQTTLNVTPAPVVTISADYCVVPGKVLLTASSVPAATTYLWNTGGTKDTIQVNVANNYSVTVTAGGCPSTGNITVAQNLVVNGDFSQGNVGFTSDYAYKPDLPGLVPAGQGELYNDSGNNGYSITPSGQNVHINFWGYDHTTESGIAPAGNFMAVNGHGNTLVVWKETVNVLPNTTYYFSAWAMSLNAAGNNAQLQFSVNGALTGTTAVLANHCEGCAGGKANDNWTQFYGNWTSGPTTTTAVIYINDLQAALSGNDFGLDDINFGTLSPFIYLVSAPGTDGQTLCVNTPITPIVYSVGSTSAGPVLSAPLPAGLTGTFIPGAGLYTITGTPTVAGNYTYTLTTTGSCNPTSATGTINIQSQTITLSSGNANPVQCKTAPVNFGFTLGGTATNAAATGLPVGVTGSTSGNIFTISGTPTDTAGVFHYTIITSGTCSPDTVKGTITLQQQTVTHNSGDSLQTVCINTPINNIVYTIGGPGSLNGTVTGLPGGVSYTYNSGILIVSGTPNVAGTFKYYITGSGTCNNAKDSGVITVTPAAALALTSAAGTDGQTVCINSSITNITYSLNNTTGATIDGLPVGVTGSATGGVFTITGIPTVAGTFNYTITSNGGCGTATATGSIIVQSQTIDLTTGTKSPTLCQNTAMTPIVFTIGGTASGATLSGQPSGVNGVLSGNTFTISGTPGVAGSFNYTVTVTGSCATTVTASGTITVTQAAIGGNIQLVSTYVCDGGTAIMTLIGQGLDVTILGWQSSVDGGTTWSALNGNTTISETASGVLVPTLWRVQVSNGCGTAYSSTATVGIHNYWTGANGTTDWNTGSNWSDGLVPSTLCPTVVVPVVPLNNYPILSTGLMATITNLQIAHNASVTITGNTIQIAGTITNGGIFNVTNGTVELNGTATQNIAGDNFANGIPGKYNTVQNLIISNNAGVNVAGTALDTLNITGTLSFGTSSAQLATGNNITLKSSAIATANVGILAAGNTITGNVTVERYFDVGKGHGASWQFVATPTQGQTVKESWMENGCCLAPPVSTGYGTTVTDPSGTTNGFDLTSSGASLKSYVYSSDSWLGIPNTAIPVYNPEGYMLFVRGDRSVSYPHVGNTTLRTTGELSTPANPPPVITVHGGYYASVGNPYASAVYMSKISAVAGPTGVSDFFYVWDPTLSGSYGVGAYRTLSNDGTGFYVPTPSGGGGDYASGTRTIESGQAFFVQSANPIGGADGTVSFDESMKANGSNLVFRGEGASGITGSITQLRANLYGVAAGASFLADGNMIQYNSIYSDKVDGYDAKKLVNSTENFGILSGGKNLVIERRTDIQQNDTIFYNMTGMRAQNYRIVFTATGLSAYGQQGFIEDTYLNTRKPLNMEGTTEADFTVTNAAASYAPNRFRIVFASKPPVPVALTFISLEAHQQDADIAVSWKVKNESGMKQYEVEKSADGVNFTKVATVTANNNGIGSYQWLDTQASTGDNYYRIRCVGMDGRISYSTVVKVTIAYSNPSISIYPNPITDGIIHLQFVNQPQGRYGIRLLNSLGQLISAKQVEHAGGNATENIQWNYYLSHGVYQLEVTKPDGSVKVIKVLY